MRGKAAGTLISGKTGLKNFLKKPLDILD